MTRHFLIALVLVSAPCMSADVPTSPATEQFAQHCMENFYATQGLFEQMKDRKAKLLEGEAAQFFLTSKPGVAWAYPEDGVDYVVALRDDGICATFASEADVNQAERAFAELAGKVPTPLVATMYPGEQWGPNAGSLRTMAYGWGRPGEQPSLVFAMTTSREPLPKVRVMLTLTRLKPESGEPAATTPEDGTKAVESPAASGAVPSTQDTGDHVVSGNGETVYPVD